jgi:hypothetical protein
MDDTKIYDCMGNELAEDNMVTMRPPDDQMLIGRITLVKPGELSKLQKKYTPGTVRIVFDVTLQLGPSTNVIRNLVRVVSPLAEEALKKAMEESTKTPPSSPVQ